MNTYSIHSFKGIIKKELKEARMKRFQPEKFRGMKPGRLVANLHYGGLRIPGSGSKLEKKPGDASSNLARATNISLL